MSETTTKTSLWRSLAESGERKKKEIPRECIAEPSEESARHGRTSSRQIPFSKSPLTLTLLH